MICNIFQLAIVVETLCIFFSAYIRGKLKLDCEQKKYTDLLHKRVMYNAYELR